VPANQLGQKPSASEVKAVTGREEFLRADQYLIPAINDDPLLRRCPKSSADRSNCTHLGAELQSDDWSDDEEIMNSAEAPSDLSEATRKIRALENALHKAQQDLADYRSFVGERLNLASLAASLRESEASLSTHVGTPLRDDDSHYFQSYGENGAYENATSHALIC
jgi:type I protein arginine methyltransferase